MTRILISSLLLGTALVASPVFAAPKLDSKQPIEIASDNLEVLQAENKAIFTGNVIAKQGSITMRSKAMTVFYEGGAEASDGEAAAGAMGKGINRIESTGDVVFITPEETAQGDKAIYNVKTDTIDLVGNVVLTRAQNILKGTTLNYNLATGRSVLNGGASATTGGGSGRVRGLFVPGSAGE
ncbi:MAG: lipopolysaccharide transport periplasmic protein LptA [Azospirillum brasilense]|nr:MAG: lipopolysaccharide transport periplasmic protein LptA [Azospirillum brasilense]